MRQWIERQTRFGLPLGLGLAACTSGSNPAGEPDATSLLDADGQSDAFFVAPVDDSGCDDAETISTTSFDQSCTSDLDCTPVGQGKACGSCGLACPSAAINKSAKAAYKAAIAALPAGSIPLFCHCPSFGEPCCDHGQCSLNCNDQITDLDACAAAGGTCVASGSLLDGGPACVRISYCAPDPNGVVTTFGVCCPMAAIADGAASD
jgi:hypothetical protein